MRYIQQIGFNRGFDDISYSWLIFADGTIGEGRGWGKVGGHTKGYNSTSYGISLVGNYHDQHFVTDAMVEAFHSIVVDGMDRGSITDPHSAIVFQPHRAVKSTACPGDRSIAKLSNFFAPPEEVDMPKYSIIQRGKTDNPSDGGEGGLWLTDGLTRKAYGSMAELNFDKSIGLVEGGHKVYPKSLFLRLTDTRHAGQVKSDTVTILAKLAVDSGGTIDVAALAKALVDDEGLDEQVASEVVRELAARLAP
jgi:hypothetical protein